jgi:DNA invertase Pin-like site-specific DNA recombinase
LAALFRLTAARARGRKGGRPPKLSAKENKTIRILLKTEAIFRGFSQKHPEALNCFVLLWEARFPQQHG